MEWADLKEGLKVIGANNGSIQPPLYLSTTVDSNYEFCATSYHHFRLIAELPLVSNNVRYVCGQISQSC